MDLDAAGFGLGSVAAKSEPCAEIQPTRLAALCATTNWHAQAPETIEAYTKLWNFLQEGSKDR